MLIRPAPPPDLFQTPQLNILVVLANIQRTPNTNTCLTRCHSGAGGGAKQGDIHPYTPDPGPDPDPLPTQDFHLASQARGGAGLSCLSCHKTEKHRIVGRGNDIRETEYLASNPNFKVDCQTHLPYRHPPW